MDIFYLGLSCLSKGPPCVTPGAFSREGRRILGLLEERAREAGYGGETAIKIEAGGRPHYRDLHADFNISHSGAMTAVSYLASDSKTARTGCDIQQVKSRELLGDMAEQFFHPSERHYLISAAKADDYVLRFHHLWVLKEAWIKIRGYSVFTMKESPVFIFNENSTDPGLLAGGMPEDPPKPACGRRGAVGKGGLKKTCRYAGDVLETSPPFMIHPHYVICNDDNSSVYIPADNDRERPPLEFFLYGIDAPKGRYAMAVCRELFQEKPEGGSLPPKIFWFSPGGELHLSGSAGFPDRRLKASQKQKPPKYP